MTDQLRLRTFGGLALERHQGKPVPEVRARWLALLAILSANGTRGATRDRVLAILWSELDAARARHNLSQLLYSLHRAFEAELVVAEHQTLRLDPALTSADAIDFSVAQGDQRWSEMMTLYHGPFADGFFLDEAPEFERWVEQQRNRFVRDAERAAETVADQADQRGDLSKARDSWRWLAELDPLNSRFALGYVMALAKSGDRGGAVRAGLAHTARLKDELGSAPPTRLTDLLDRLQRGTFVSSAREDISKPDRPAQ